MNWIYVNASRIEFIVVGASGIGTEYITETALCIPLAVAVQINKTLAAYVIEDGNVTAAFELNWVARRGY